MDVIEALRADRPVLLPADGVYGLCALAASETAVRNLYELKGRGTAQPTAIIAVSVEVLLEAIPELPRPLLDRFLPGAYTLVLRTPSAGSPG
jgi:L-threonylcarbamoyladenylate synthase